MPMLMSALDWMIEKLIPHYEPLTEEQPLQDMFLPAREKMREHEAQQHAYPGKFV